MTGSAFIDVFDYLMFLCFICLFMLYLCFIYALLFDVSVLINFFELLICNLVAKINMEYNKCYFILWIDVRILKNHLKGLAFPDLPLSIWNEYNKDKFEI